MPIFEDLKVFTGNSHPALARDICSYLGLGLGECEVFKFSNDESFVRIKENIREKDVFLVQSVGKPVNDSVMELLIMIDAARRASAGRITTVIPYYPYGRTDKKDQPRVAITARLLAQQFSHLKRQDLVVAATDVGAAKRARYMADHLDAPIAIIDKQRLGNEDRVRAVNVIGNVEGKTALIVDDEINTGGTVAAAADALKDHGAAEIYCTAVHPILSGNAPEALSGSNMVETVVTDTLPLPPEKRFEGLKVVSVAGLLGEAIHRIHSGLSVGAMFN